MIVYEYSFVVLISSPPEYIKGGFHLGGLTFWGVCIGVLKGIDI